MKIISNFEFRTPNSECAIRHSQFVIRNSERGMATVIFIVLLAVMMILVTAESSALFHLHREVKFLERQQIKRLDNSQTNAISAVTLTVKPEVK
jgi:hypothetical protein